MFCNLLLFSFAFWLEPTRGFYSKVVNDHKLNRRIFSVLHKQDWLSCIIACAGISNCVSYNYKTGSLKGKTTPGGFCELSNIGTSFPASVFTERSGNGIIYTDGWVFHQIRPYKVKTIDIILKFLHHCVLKHFFLLLINLVIYFETRSSHLCV